MTCGILWRCPWSFHVFPMFLSRNYGPPWPRGGSWRRKSQKAGKLPPVPRQRTQIHFQKTIDFTMFLPWNNWRSMDIVGPAAFTERIAPGAVGCWPFGFGCDLSFSGHSVTATRGRFWSTAVHGQSFNMVINMDIVRSPRPSLWSARVDRRYRRWFLKFQISGASEDSPRVPLFAVRLRAWERVLICFDHDLFRISRMRPPCSLWYLFLFLDGRKDCRMRGNKCLGTRSIFKWLLGFWVVCISQTLTCLGCLISFPHLGSLKVAFFESPGPKAAKKPWLQGGRARGAKKRFPVAKLDPDLQPLLTECQIDKNLNLYSYILIYIV